MLILSTTAYDYHKSLQKFKKLIIVAETQREKTWLVAAEICKIMDKLGSKLQQHHDISLRIKPCSNQRVLVQETLG